MNPSEFELIKKKAEVFLYSSMEYIEQEDVAEYQILTANERLVLLLGYNKEAKCFEYHWATNSCDLLAEHLICDETFIITFIPQEWVPELETAGLQVRNAWHDYFLSNLDEVDDQAYTAAEFLSPQQCLEASEVTQSCIGRSRGFTGQTPDWIMEWISSTNPAVNNAAILISRSSDGKINGVVCMGTYAYDSDKGPVAWIREVAVLPEYQNTGIGRRLITQALSYGKHNGARRAFLAVDENNTNAIHLYQSFGFEPSYGMSQIDMIKLIHE